MHSLEPEISQLRLADPLDGQAAQRFAAMESGAAFSLYLELRIIGYAAVLLVVTGIGLMLKEHFDRIGPVAVAWIIGLLAAGCYAHALRSRWHGEERSLIGDYVLLLGGMLVSADVAFLEVQFHWLGDRWALHLLLLVLFHGVCAYVFDSRLLLSLALAAFSGWMGVSRNLDNLFGSGDSALQYGARALLAGLVVWVGRELNHRSVRRPRFDEVYEHYAINFAFWGALMWCGQMRTLLAGVLLSAVLSVGVVSLGRRRRSEWFAVYGVVYGAIGFCLACAQLLRDPFLVSALVLAVIAAAVSLLRSLYRKIQEPSA
jgi:hypothetical protein